MRHHSSVYSETECPKVWGIKFCFTSAPYRGPAESLRCSRFHQCPFTALPHQKSICNLDYLTHSNYLGNFNVARMNFDEDLCHKILFMKKELEMFRTVGMFASAIRSIMYYLSTPGLTANELQDQWLFGGFQSIPDKMLLKVIRPVFLCRKKVESWSNKYPE